MKVLEINKEDLIYNINKIKAHIENNNNVSKIIGVVKGNGYGLGIMEIANILVENEINILAVSSIEEAIELKEAEIDADILLLGATAEKSELLKMIENNIIITVSSFNDIDTLEEMYEENGFEIRAHIKIDTGFNRYGFKIEELKELSERLQKLDYLKIEGTFSHFSYAYYKNDKFVNKQFKTFKEGINILNENNIDTGMLHICNTSAFVKHPEMHLDAVRIGSAFLGRMQVKNELNLKKIGKFYATISEIKNIKKGETIGYSNSEKAKKNLKVAILQVRIY
ncbi:MAG: alanine racemase [Clostridia bacterium]|nr:alanine racemase [Clostridia bacterium]